MSEQDRRLIVAALGRDLSRVSRDLMTNVHAALVDTTPVDTGWAKTNWIPSVGAPVLETAGTRAEAEAGSLDRSPQDAGLARVRAYELKDGDLYDVNNVPYIQKLNAGSSAQAPAAFVQSAILRGIRETG